MGANLKEHEFKFSCSQCHASFLRRLSEEPTQIICPNGHKLGVWSYDREEERHCKICANQPLIATMHYRKRHDKMTPKGLPIIVPDPFDVEETLSHYAELHKDVLKQAKKAVFGK